MSEELRSRIVHLRDVEHLSLTQISSTLRVSRRKVTGLLCAGDAIQPLRRPRVLAPYERLIEQWYGQYPSLKAIQVLDRLRPYGFKGGYTAVKEYTRPFRKKRQVAFFHELHFLPGEEAQVDWMQRRFDFGVVYGFVYVLAFSRYLYARFYPRSSLEFFLDGHLEAFREIGGIPRNHRYDNLKSVVLHRKPEITFNGQFLDFAHHYTFTPRPCTPGRANEKGRVERVIRDIEGFLETHTFVDFVDLNRQFGPWRIERNNRPHRSTGVAPAEKLKEEPLQPLPAMSYLSYRQVSASVSKTGFVSFDQNRYSVPSPYSGRPGLIRAFPNQLQVLIGQKVIATHERLFTRGRTIEHPLHRERLLAVTPHYKAERIERLIRSMSPALDEFLRLSKQEGKDPRALAYELFKLLKHTAKDTLISAVRASLQVHIAKLSYVRSLLGDHLPVAPAVHPQDSKLLDITYEGRSLHEYDELL
jgi:transposase